MGKVIAPLLLATLAACASPQASFCTIATAMRPSAASLATMSDAEVDALLAHNLKGQRLCGWTPSKPSK